MVASRQECVPDLTFLSNRTIKLSSPYEAIEGSFEVYKCSDCDCYRKVESVSEDTKGIHAPDILLLASHAQVRGVLVR